MTTTSRGRKFTYNIINTELWEREWASALQTIHTVRFLQKLSTTDDVTKYRTGIAVFLRLYIIVGHFLIPRIPRPNPIRCGRRPESFFARRAVTAARFSWRLYAAVWRCGLCGVCIQTYTCCVCRYNHAGISVANRFRSSYTSYWFRYECLCTCPCTCRCRAKSSMRTSVAPLAIQTVLWCTHYTCVDHADWQLVPVIHNSLRLLTEEILS